MSSFSKFKSLREITADTKTTFLQHPAALLCAIIATSVSVALIEVENFENSDVLGKILVVSALGVPLFIALSTLGIVRDLTKTARASFHAVGLLLLAAYYITLPDNIGEPLMYLVRSALLAISFHFLVAWLPFINSSRTDRFWHYNTTLFTRFLTATLYSFVLFVGIAIATAAVDHLFGVTIDEKRYFQLWVIITGVFNTWFFLSGMCEGSSAFGETGDYPRALKVFGQNILLPLVSLYFLILISYEAKILMTWNWPKGWVSQLVLWFSVLGILSLLILHPLKDRAEYSWIRKYVNRYFIALVPLLIMLFLAIFRRISDYGMTENRYLVLAMAVGLALVAVYFIFSKTKDIKIIPAVLFFVSFLASIGPWSASSLSLSSQKGRLVEYLAEARNEDGGYDFAEKPLTDISIESRREISSIVQYLAEFHGLEPFDDLFDDSALADLDTLSSYLRPQEITQILGFEYLHSLSFRNAQEYFNVRAKSNRMLSITEYDFLGMFKCEGTSSNSCDEYLESLDCRLVLDADREAVAIQFGVDASAGADTIRISLADLIESHIGRNNDSDASSVSFDDSGSVYNVKLIVEELNGRRDDGKTEISHAQFLLFVGVK